MPRFQLSLFTRQGLEATKINSFSFILFAIKIDSNPPRDQPKRIDFSGINLIISLHQV